MVIGEDYFPRSLPALNPSNIMNVVGIMDYEEDETFRQFTNNAVDDSQQIYLGLPQDPTTNHGILDSSALQSQTFTKFSDTHRQLGFDPSFSVSPSSSLKDSSSDSSIQRQSESSSNSSGSRGHAAKNLCHINGRVASWDTQESVSGPNLRETSLDADFLTSGALDSRNLTPEYDFNFECGSESSVRFGILEPDSYNPLSQTNMPFRSSPTPSFIARRGRGHRAGASGGSIGDSSLSSTSRKYQTWPAKFSYLANPNLPGTQCNEAVFNNPTQQLVNGIDFPLVDQISSENASSYFYSGAPGMPAAISMPVASPTIMPPYDEMQSTLRIHQNNDKSRVETQIPIKLTLCPVPVGITKLHLPSHTVSKPKQLADPSLSRSPDMLELDCMLVCTTAMRDEVKREAAFAASRTNSKDDFGMHAHSSSLGTNEELKPCDGGKVRICSTCITREEKRAGRKKAKIEERAELWQKLAEDRIVIFNSNEVVEWQVPSEPKPAKTLTDSTAIKIGHHNDYPSSLSPRALQVDLPMRIACYCRHQDERLGFQVIFTLKNHQGRCIAQSITNSITITDDHKTSSAPLAANPQNRPSPENMQFPGAGVFSQESPNYYIQGSMRQNHSFPNLQAAQHQQNIQPQPGFPLAPYTTSQISSQNTPSTMTPHSLSRPVSPSAPSGPYPKKRKSSGSGKVSNELVMTKLHSQDSPNIPVSSSMSTGSSIDLASQTVLVSPNVYNSPNVFVGQHQSGHTPSMVTRYNTNPPTPVRIETNWPAPGPRSQSMDNISLGMRVPRTPPDPMKNSQENSSDVPLSHPDSLANPIHENLFVNAPQGMILGQQTRREPTQEPAIQPSHPIIEHIAPVTGPMAGGIEVICLGTGFYEGLEIVFGNTVATTRLVRGESDLLCVLPPATNAISVPVHCNHDYREAASWPPTQQIYFTYIDDSELQLLRLALTTINHKITGRREDPRKIARDTINGQHSRTPSQDDRVGQSREQHHQVSGSITALTTSADFEGSLLGCLDIIDLDDSPIQTRFNSRGPNGQSMLHFSASLGYYRFAAALLARGANPDLRDYNGMSPMHIASLNNHPNLIRKLRSAGGDPTLRSLRGLTPADMASTNEVRDVFDAIENFSWPRGIEAPPPSRQSRASSTSSSQPCWRAWSMSESVEVQSDSSENLVLAISNQEEDDSLPDSHIASPAQSWGRSRRNSVVVEKSYLNCPLPVDRAGSDRFLAAATAWSVWRDQLLAQVQTLQQSVHRTFPALPIPTLPPIPNLPDYQAYPVVRRISSLVPQRYPRALNPDLKENDYHWWDLLRGASPPAYSELFPNQEQNQPTINQDSTKGAAGEALVNAKVPSVLDPNVARPASILDTVRIDSSSLTLEHRKELMAAHAVKVKRLRSDRKLFFFWIPLLVFVLIALLKDRVAQFWHVVNPTLQYLQNRF